MNRPFFSFAVLLAALLAVTPLGAQEADYTPTLEPGDCPFDTPRGLTVDCGSMIVPQNRAEPDGTPVSIAYAVFRTNSDNPRPDPLIYLDGGPGTFSLEVWGSIFLRTFGPFIEHRDVILFDYRGTGESEPSLYCEETLEWTLETLDDDLTDAEATSSYYAALDACRARVLEDGVDLDQYDSAAFARDVVDLWTALGYDQVDLLGISYGTRLALTLMRDYPDQIRSVVLDGVLPLEVNRNATLIRNADRAYEALFAACEANAACADAYPDLRTVTYETARQLDEEPILIDITLPETGETYSARVDGGGFLNTLFQALYATWLIPSLPATIYEVSAGDYDQLAFLVGTFTDNTFSFSDGLYVAQECNEELPFNTIESIEEAAAEFPELSPLFNTEAFVGEQAYLDNCADWFATLPDAAENEPVVSDIPTLIFSGQFDPITPPAWGDQVAANLENSFVYTLPGIGHGATTSGEVCPVTVAHDFIENPFTTPDDDCIADLQVAFETPIREVTLVRFHDDNTEINGVHPDGWQAVGATSYAASRSLVNSVTYFVYPDDRGQFLISLGDYFGGTLLKSFNPVQAGGKSWTLYTMQATAITEFVTVATTEIDNVVFMVIITAGSQEEMDILFEELLLPGLSFFEVGEVSDRSA